MLNKYICEGRFTTNPELKESSSGIPYTTFSLAVPRNYIDINGDHPAPDFIKFAAWRNAAVFICKHFKKGDCISIVGSLQSKNYKDKEGNSRTTYEVLVEETYFTGSKAKSGKEQAEDDDIPPLPDEIPPQYNEVIEHEGSC